MYFTSADNCSYARMRVYARIRAQCECGITEVCKRACGTLRYGTLVVKLITSGH